MPRANPQFRDKCAVVGCAQPSYGRYDINPPNKDGINCLVQEVDLCRRHRDMYWEEDSSDFQRVFKIRTDIKAICGDREELQRFLAASTVFYQTNEGDDAYDGYFVQKNGNTVLGAYWVRNMKIRDCSVNILFRKADKLKGLDDRIAPVGVECGACDLCAPKSQ